MATFGCLKHPVIILLTDFTSPDKLTYDLDFREMESADKCLVDTYKGFRGFK